MSKKLLIISICLFLIGCSIQRRWTKENYIEDRFQEDKFDCEFKSSLMTQTEKSALIHGFEKQRIFDKCMKSKGYHLAK